MLKLTKISNVVFIELLTFVLAFLETIKPFIIGESIDDILTSNSQMVVKKLIVYTLLIVIASSFDYIQAVLMSKSVLDIELKCSKIFLSKISKEKTDKYLFSNEVMLNDIPQVSRLAVQMIDIVIFNTMSACIILYYCLVINIYLTSILFFSIPLLYLINSYLGNRMNQLNEKYKNNIDSLNYEVSYLKEGIPAIKSIKAFDYIEDKFIRLIKNINIIKYRISLYLSFKTIVFEFLNYMIYLIILVAGILLIYQQNITVGEFISFNSYSVILTKNFNAVLELLYMKRDFNISFYRVFFTKNEIENKIIYDDLKGNSIQLNNVSLFLNEDEILKSINYNFPEKGLVFIVGSNGSGKSSLLKLIGGLHDRFDGEIRINKSQSNIVYLPQTPVIFKDSISNNITLGKRISNHHLEAIIQKLGLEELISKNKVITNRSLDLTLSGGEKQKVSFARLMLANPDILLLDEFDSALDNTTSDMLYEIIRQISKEKLVILVTHDLKKINDDDIFIFIDKGTIIDHSNL